MDEYVLSDQALIKARDRKSAARPPREPNTFYVYDLAANECMLETVLKIFLGRDDEEGEASDDDLESLRIFNAGNSLQDWWEDQLKELGYYIMSREFRARWYPEDRPWKVHGRGDLLAQDPDHGIIRVREVKTIKGTKYVANEPKVEHAYQDQYYLNILGIENGTVDYIDKLNFATGDNPVVLIHDIQRDSSVMDYLLKVGDVLYKWCAPIWELAESMDPITPEDILNLLASREIELPTKNVCWKCNMQNRKKKIYCNYYDICDKVTRIQNSLNNNP